MSVTESADLQQIGGQQFAADFSDWGKLSAEVAEHILALVPLTSLIRATSVNKQWYSAIHSPVFVRLCAKHSNRLPWLFVYCTNFLLPAKNQSYAFDPDSCTWYTLPAVTPPVHSHASLAGGVEGLIFATMGVTQSRLCYNHSLFVKKWKETSDMTYPRDAPLVGFIEDSGSGGDACRKLIAVGGVEMFEEDDLAVEIYDPVLNQWEVTKGLPGEFRGNSSRHWLSGAVWKGKFYVLEIYSGSIAAFDLKLKTWSTVQTLRPLKPSGVKYAYLIVCQGMLILAGVCHSAADDKAYFKLWLVDETRMLCKEMGCMPLELFSLFKNSENEKDVTGMKCVASDSLVYVYSVSPLAEYPMVVCDIACGWNGWMKLPPLPTLGNRYDTMVGFCSSLSLGAVLR